MPKNLLSAHAAKAAPRPKPYKLTDGGGLHLLINPDGRRFWRYRFKIAGRESMASLGEFPAVTLAAARDARDAAAKKVAVGVSPVAEKRAEREARGDRFSTIADEYAAEHFAALDPDTSRNERKRLEYLTDALDGKPLAEITPADVAAAIRSIKAEHGHDGARRCHGRGADLGPRRVARQGRAEPRGRVQGSRRARPGADEKPPQHYEPEAVRGAAPRDRRLRRAARHADRVAGSGARVRAPGQGASQVAMVGVRPRRGDVDVLVRA